MESVNTKMRIPRYFLKDENGNKIDGHFVSYQMIRVDLTRYRATIIKSRTRNKQTQGIWLRV